MSYTPDPRFRNDGSLRSAKPTPQSPEEFLAERDRKYQEAAAATRANMSNQDKAFQAKLDAWNEKVRAQQEQERKDALVARTKAEADAYWKYVAERKAGIFNRAKPVGFGAEQAEAEHKDRQRAEQAAAWVAAKASGQV